MSPSQCGSVVFCTTVGSTIKKPQNTLKQYVLLLFYCGPYGIESGRHIGKNMKACATRLRRETLTTTGSTRVRRRTYSEALNSAFEWSRLSQPACRGCVSRQTNPKFH